VKVVQELLRHANITTTMNLYAQAFSERARQAQSNVIEMVKKSPFKRSHRPRRRRLRLLCINVHEGGTVIHATARKEW
jgi:hypothetical protein